MPAWSVCLLTLLLVPVHTAAGGSIQCSSAELPSFCTKSSAQWPSLVFQPLLLTGNKENLPWSWIFLSSFSLCLDKCGITICNAHQCCHWNSISFALLQENLWSASQKTWTPTTYNDKCEKLGLSWILCELKSPQQYSSSKQTINQCLKYELHVRDALFFLNAHRMFSVPQHFCSGLADHSLCKARPLYFQ